MFFFSSRRRHTRSLCDWSSDVCSSDLLLPPVVTFSFIDPGFESLDSFKTHVDAYLRSEERRVGKECRSRWWRYHEKKNEKRQLRGATDRSTARQIMKLTWA